MSALTVTTKLCESELIPIVSQSYFDVSFDQSFEGVIFVEDRKIAISILIDLPVGLTKSVTAALHMKRLHSKNGQCNQNELSLNLQSLQIKIKSRITRCYSKGEQLNITNAY